MTDWTAFILASLALLTAPGPTNTLLAASGAAAGFVRSLPLLLAEQCGYWISITVLAIVLGPAVSSSPSAAMALKLLCAAWLIWSAWRLWREGNDEMLRSQPVKLSRVFVTTLLNPKAIVFALVILPYLRERRVAEALPYIGGLCLLMAAVASGWAAAGALIRASRVAGEGVMRKVGAAALALFGVLLSTSVLMPMR